jgi:CheY-like chemotaxis protein
MKTTDLRNWFSPVICFEDDASVRRALVMISRKSGITVRAFATPEEAKTALAKNSFRAGIFDIRDANEKSTGLDLAEQFRANHTSGYLEIVTGFDQEDYRKRAARMRADRYTCKPVDPAKVVNHLIYGMLRKRLACVAQKQQLDLDGLLADFCREFDIPIPDDQTPSEPSLSLASFNALLKEATEVDDIQDPFFLAKLVAAAEKMWAESRRRQGPYEEAALMLLKASRILLRDGPTPEKMAALTGCANVLNRTSVTEDDVCKVDDSLRAAGIDVLIQLAWDEAEHP